jgi:hypothetical protein
MVSERTRGIVRHRGRQRGLRFELAVLLADVEVLQLGRYLGGARRSHASRLSKDLRDKSAVESINDSIHGHRREFTTQLP